MEMYKPSKGILTIDELITCLNLDEDYNQFSKLQELSLEASQYLYEVTGYDWSADAEINYTAKGAARDYIYEIWYGGDDHVHQRLEHLIHLLQSMVIKDKGELNASLQG